MVRQLSRKYRRFYSVCSTCCSFIRLLEKIQFSIMCSEIQALPEVLTD